MPAQLEIASVGGRSLRLPLPRQLSIGARGDQQIRLIGHNLPELLAELYQSQGTLWLSAPGSAAQELPQCQTFCHSGFLISWKKRRLFCNRLSWLIFLSTLLSLWLLDRLTLSHRAASPKVSMYQLGAAALPTQPPWSDKKMRLLLDELPNNRALGNLLYQALKILDAQPSSFLNTTPWLKRLEASAFYRLNNDDFLLQLAGAMEQNPRQRQLMEALGEPIPTKNLRQPAVRALAKKLNQRLQEIIDAAADS